MPRVPPCEEEMWETDAGLRAMQEEGHRVHVPGIQADLFRALRRTSVWRVPLMGLSPRISPGRVLSQHCHGNVEVSPCFLGDLIRRLERMTSDSILTSTSCRGFLLRYPTTAVSGETNLSHVVGLQRQWSR